MSIRPFQILLQKTKHVKHADKLVNSLVERHVPKRLLNARKNEEKTEILKFSAKTNHFYLLGPFPTLTGSTYGKKLF